MNGTQGAVKHSCVMTYECAQNYYRTTEIQTTKPQIDISSCTYDSTYECR